MKIHLHIGLDPAATNRLQTILSDKREQLIGKGVLFPRSPGGKNHTRLFMAVTDPDHIDPLRFNRGYILPDRQESLLTEVSRGIRKEVEAHAPQVLILSAVQLGQSLARPSELKRLRALLLPFSDGIEVTAHVDEQAGALARHYAGQVMEGRATPLTVEQAIPEGESWWDAALAAAPQVDPAAGQFLETQAPPFWLDHARLVAEWEAVFGAGRVHLRSVTDALWSETGTEEARAAFGLDDAIGKAEPAARPGQPSAAWVARGRQMNDALLRLLARGGRVVPRPLWTRFMEEIAFPGEPIAPESLSTLVKRFETDNAALAKAHPGLSAEAMKPPPAGDPWVEADPERGFRATQYLLSFMFRIDKATAEEKDKLVAAEAVVNGDPVPPEALNGANGHAPSPEAMKIMPPLALQKYDQLMNSPFRPHNRIGRTDEEAEGEAYAPAPARKLPKGSTGNVIVGCMKNEAPYILEWVAYHRAVGFDDFLIYTNDCTDGTDAILGRLDEMGVLNHRDNNGWKGNSPQQHALDNAVDEPVLKKADWIAHIDVDEFVNIRCGNGTLSDFFERVPDATAVAMTWRLFGHNGVTSFEDRMVIEQFDRCAPKYCPKPHTAWGFKTLFRNDGVYGKLSCHRPNKPDQDRLDKVAWVNGSGQPMGKDVVRNGWRNSKKSIGYDLIQLNHYALRSAESYLIKRQRGRALHVDRSIGLNYWIRMDWTDFRDVTIKRNIPRVREEMDRLLADPTLRKLHEDGVTWHRAKAEELHGMPEFEDLYRQALTIRLNESERVAYALALDLES